MEKKQLENDLPPLPTWFEKHLDSKKDTLLPKSLNQQFKSFPNLEQSHIDLFKSDSRFNPIFQKAQYSYIPDQTGRYVITLPKGKAWECIVCKRKHQKNSNRPFLYFSNDESLWYSCRGKGTCIKVISNDKFDLQIAKDKYEEGSPVFMEYLNRFLAKVTDLNNTFYCFRSCTKSPWIIRRKKDTREALEHQAFTLKDGKLVQIFEYWIKQSSINTFKTIVLDPSFVGDIPGDKLNLFKGFKATKLDTFDETLIEPILYHIKSVLSDGIQEHHSFLINWLAHIVQKPHIKTCSAIVNFGSQGTGKNLFYEWFGDQIIGKSHYVYISDIEDLTGQFTSLYAEKIFAIADEVSFSGDIKRSNKLKSLITQPTQKLERKGCDAQIINNYLNIVYLSNSDKSVRVESTDRRHFIKRVSDIHRGDLEYFEKLSNSLNETCANHFYTYLMQLDIRDFKPQKVPDTIEKQEMKIHAMSPEDLFVEELVSGSIVYSVSLYPIEYFEPGKTYDYTMDKLWEAFQEFCKSGKAGTISNYSKKLAFGKVIRKKLVIENSSTNRKGGTPISLTIQKR